MDTASKEALLLELKHKKPTVKWLTRMIEGFDLIDIWAIWESEIIFDNFIYGLMKIENATEDDIIACLDKVILRFNEIGALPTAKYGAFIETVEREEILMYLAEAATTAGLRSDVDIDDMVNVVRDW
ncbi:MAG: hypothetical protein R2824_17185 [Saprospiraceae bacterium]